jgi:CelD/BcsL family acetyltransferase involved in cellulose biosynthesis
VIGCPPKLACRVVTDSAELERLEPAWAALLERSASNEPTLSPPWLLTWWRVFGGREGRRLRCVVFEEDGRLVGLAPLLCRWSWYRRCIPFRRLEPLASGEREADAICSDYLNIVAERGAEAVVAELLTRALISGKIGSWDELRIPLMDGGQPMAALLSDACRQAGLFTETVVTTHAPHIPLPPTWDAYLKSLTKKHRQQLRYALRDFDAWAGTDQTVEEVNAHADLSRGLAILTDLHKQRWRDTPEGGVFRSPLFNAFHDALLPRLLERNALQLLWLCARGRPVAAMYNIIWNNKVYFYQSGRDTSLPGDLRPGIVVIAKAIQKAIAAGLREFDFLGGDATYKTQLALARRPLVELRVSRPGFRETARRLLEAGAAGYRRVRRAPVARGNCATSA